ncbi:hypothetical protein HHK36_012817 [Tetracentron sinense]|uniref:Fe2OG dioxygenase domain-containing protein n=1 Tax=Tetracentron sinense TaxID=13715 RepID=A0A835DEW7_TETSI|nr:hypothetical protein HHK36_012817 [Tetracentron sinense]
MENLVSKMINVESVQESYVLPLGKRPGKLIVPLCKTIPVVNLGGGDGRDQTEIIQQILKASQEFGFFQVINHGVSVKTSSDMLSVAKEFFEMPVEDIATLYSDDSKQICRVCTSIDYDKEEVHYWRDSLRHLCHPVEEYMHLWPQKPTIYREVVATYSVEMRKLGSRLLDLIGEGLGLESGYFGDELSSEELLMINNYPACPDPSLTLGLPKHSDPNLITLLLQEDVYGLQVFKDGQWIGIEPLPNAFVVNLGHQLQIISNGMLRSADHRVVTNSSVARTTVATFIHPSSECIIEPAKPLVKAHGSPLYRAFQYKEFNSNYRAKIKDKRWRLELGLLLLLGTDGGGIGRMVELLDCSLLLLWSLAAPTREGWYRDRSGAVMEVVAGYGDDGAAVSWRWRDIAVGKRNPLHSYCGGWFK